MATTRTEDERWAAAWAQAMYGHARHQDEILDDIRGLPFDASEARRRAWHFYYQHERKKRMARDKAWQARGRCNQYECVKNGCQSVTTADGHGAYCRWCGETLA